MAQACRHLRLGRASAGAPGLACCLLLAMLSALICAWRGSDFCHETFEPIKVGFGCNRMFRVSDLKEG